MSGPTKQARGKRRGYWALFLNLSFMLLWVGQLISYLGDRLDQMTLIRLVQDDPTVDCDRVMTWIGFYILLPFILFAPWAGPVADRYSRKAILLWTSLFQGLLVAAVPTVGRTEFVQQHLIAMIYLVTFLIGAFTIFFYTAKTAMIPQIVEDDELMAANSLSSFAGTLMTLVGTFVAAALLVLVDRGVLRLSVMFYLDAASYFISGAMFAFIVVRRPQTLAQPAATESFGRKLREGLRYLARHRRILKLIALSVVVMFLAGLVFAVVNGAVLGKGGLGWPVTKYALAVGVLGIGMLSGAIATTLFRKRIRSFELFVAACFAITAVTILAFINLRRDILVGMPFAAILWRKLVPPLVVMGMCGGSLIVFVTTLLQRLVPRRFHGRVFALNSMCEVIAQLAAMAGAAVLLGMGMLKTVILTGCSVAVAAMIGAVFSNENSRYPFLRAIVRSLVKVYCRFQDQGREHVPRRGGLIVASNHVSFLDTMFLGCAIPRPVHFIAAREYYDRWYLRWIMRLFGAIPLERGKGQREPFKRALAILRRGRVLGVFPEGRMSLTGKMQPIQGGIALMALETGAPILPVGLIGPDRVMAANQRFPRPHKVRVRIGPLIDPTGLSREEILARVEKAIRERAEQTDPSHCASL